MTETEFIDQNKDKWEELELLLKQDNKDANTLHRLFVKVSSDLSYARTYYPNRSLRLYLNNLTQDVFNLMGRPQKATGFAQVVHFFTHVLPLEVYRSRRAFLVSFLVFSLSLLIGVISSSQNPEFATIILGKQYIEMTNENIEKDDPMAVYKDERKLDMFFGITYNNIRVAFLAFVVGLFGSMGTILILMTNGIMVGAFQYYFYSKGYFLTSFLTIWIHGTIEISAIIIAGAAGIILGNGLLFPKTYSRSSALQISSRRAIRILLGTVPLFIIAGLLEAFVTRLTEMPIFLKLFIIGGSLGLIVFMFMIYPWLQNRRVKTDDITDIQVNPYFSPLLKYDKYSYKEMGQIFSISATQFREYFQLNAAKVVLPLTAVSAIILWFNLNLSDKDIWFDHVGQNALFAYPIGGLFMFIFLTVIVLIIFSCLSIYQYSMTLTIQTLLIFIKQQIKILLPVSLLTVSLYYYIPYGFGTILSIFFFCQIAIPLLDNKIRPDRDQSKSFQGVISHSFNTLFSYALFYVILFCLYRFMQFTVASPMVDMLSKFIHWHSFFEEGYLSTIYVNHVLGLLIFLLFSPFIYFLFINQYYSIESKVNATDLKLRMKSFGQSNS